MTDLGNIAGKGGSISEANGINDLGEVVGYIDTPTYAHACLWKNGNIIDLGSLGTLESITFSINNSGQIVGYSRIPSGNSSAIHAFIWQNGTMTDIGSIWSEQTVATSINNIGQIVGWTVNVDDCYAAYWQNLTMTTLKNQGELFKSEARSINNYGQIVGSMFIDSNDNHAFLWQNGNIVDLGPGDALSINDLGQVVGSTKRSFLSPAMPPAMLLLLDR